MKKIHILALIVVVAAIGVVMSLSMNSSTYAGFEEASEHPGREYHVIGTLSPDRPVEYDAMKDANSFSFYMLDNEGVEMLVRYSDTKPQDFEKLDQLVVIGKMKDGHFSAHKMNLKCPSKYNSDQVPEGFEETKFVIGNE
ncbi:MAG TPA: cytochrome c maturation protein CcmE [Lentimicrobium sp.]|jgi:cytochrome c-type biogenesis protein CcmE|nr:cytochrome c maturation protein CcmE [Lentimicrobium sp.]